MELHNEIEFEKAIAEHLATNGWLYSPNDAGYDRKRALFPEDVFAWLQESQPKELAKVITAGSASEAKQRDQLLDRLVKSLEVSMENGGGTLNVLRNGFQHVRGKFGMCQFKPESTLNADTVADYERVHVRVMRQVHFSTSDQRSIDLVFFVNGIPVATVELKTDFTQTIHHAIDQYKNDRHPTKYLGKTSPQPLLTYGRGALVHFVVSNDVAFMTTKLAGSKTFFLPFNRGTEDGGAGNPLNVGGSRTSYLWERVWKRDAWLNIIGRFLYVNHTTSTDPISGKVSKSSVLRFPRFHQWDAVTSLIETVKTEGVGQRYLVEHSAGSGKTDSISWTAHRLAQLQVDNTKVFDSVIVVTDRNVLDAQLQDAIRQIERTTGVVTTIDQAAVNRSGVTSKSALLAKVLLEGKLIVVVTIQTFPFAMQAIQENKGLKGKRFAVIADEAHSSQTGQTASKLKAVLTAEEFRDIEDGGEIDVEALLADAAEAKADSSNISYFAFTATPKAKTLELFGRRPNGDPDEKPLPFHRYTMKQAIEEGFILDVLRGYRNFKLAFKVALNSGGPEEEVDESKAQSEVMKWVKLNPQTISQKATIIVDHFHEVVAPQLEGHAKAMVVTDSRKAAVRYKLAIDRYIRDHKLPYSTLVAFSGSVSDPESGPGEFTEATMNPGVHDLRTHFAQVDECKVMIVANKFQTGFDQPLLCGMYVDRRLANVQAVQTLSRLNRTYRTPNGISKTAAATSVVDFVNSPEEIQQAFEPYFTGAYLETETDPNLVHDLATKLDQAGIYTEGDVEKVNKLLLTAKATHEKLTAAMGPAVERFRSRYAVAVEAGDKAELDVLDMFRKDVGTYVRLYDFMSQIINYGPDREALSNYLRPLERLIRDTERPVGIDLSDLVLTKVKQVDKGPTDIKLGIEDIGLKGVIAGGSGQAREPKMVAMQQVLDILNDLFGGEAFVEGQTQSFLEAVLRTLLMNRDLVTQARANSMRQFTESPDFEDAVSDAVADNQGAMNKIADFIYSNDERRPEVVHSLGKLFYEWAKADEAGAAEGVGL